MEKSQPSSAHEVGWVRRALRSRGLYMYSAILVFGACVWIGIDRAGGLDVVRERFGLWAALVLVPLQALVSITFFPGEVVAILNAAIYGFRLGALFAWLGWLGASFLQYWLVTHAHRDLGGSPEAMMQRLPQFLRRYGPHHPVFLIVARNMPMGGHIVNTVAAVFGVPFWRFAWTGVIGLAPWAIAVSALANGLVQSGWLSSIMFPDGS